MTAMQGMTRREWLVCAALSLLSLLIIGRVFWRRYTTEAFTDAVVRGDIPRVERLLAWGGPPNLRNYPYLSVALSNHNTPLALLLLRAGCAGNLDEYLCESAQFGDVAVMEDLIRRGANPNAMCGGLTALMEAAQTGPQPTKVLLDYGADANRVCNTRKELLGETALTRAIAYGNANTVSLLLKRGADPNPRLGANVHRATALIFTAAVGQSDIVQVLLQYHADVNARDSVGDTALVCAKREWRLRKRAGCDRAISLLLSAGAKR